MQKAMAANSLLDMKFGIEQVYTESETLCGVKEWLQDSTTASSAGLAKPPTHMDEYQVGDPPQLFAK